MGGGEGKRGEGELVFAAVFLFKGGGGGGGRSCVLRGVRGTGKVFVVLCVCGCVVRVRVCVVRCRGPPPPPTHTTQHHGQGGCVCLVAGTVSRTPALASWP